MELVARSDLAHALRRSGDLDGAEAAYREVVPEWQRLGHRAAVAHLLESFAFIAIERDDPRRAAVLLGAAQPLRQAAEASMLIPERAEYEREVAKARAALGDPEFDQAWSRGTALSSEDAVAFAVSG